MTDKITILRAFNKYFFEFIDDIIRIFPDNVDVYNSKTSFDLFKKANPTCLLKAWKTFVYEPYHDVIQQGYIDFFFEKDYKDDLKQMANANQIMGVIDTIREPLRDLDVKNKEIAVKYIQNLSKLANLYQ